MGAWADGIVCVGGVRGGVGGRHGLHGCTCVVRVGGQRACVGVLRGGVRGAVCKAGGGKPSRKETRSWCGGRETEACKHF